MHRIDFTRGFSLLEVATSLIVVAIMAAAIVPLAASLMDTNAANQTYTELAAIYTATVGDPVRGNYGYIGDVGKFPDNLMDLVRKPGSNPPGWNGPYLNDARVDGDVLYDAHGSPIECYYLRDANTAVADVFAVISRGPDRSSTNTSSTPNECSTFTGTLPSNAAYATTGTNPDNIVYPRFTDNAGMLNYQHVGTLAINLFNFDQNSKVSAVVPACPHFFTITVTSVSRGANDTFSMVSNPGANTVDLRQGLYQVSITSQSSSSPLWQERIAITAGATQTRNITLAGLDSSVTTNEIFMPINEYDFGDPQPQNRIQVQQLDSPTNVGQVDYGNQGPGDGNWAQIRPCTQITIRQNDTSGTIVDAFTYPYLVPTDTPYQRKVNQNARYTLTVVNKNISNSALKEQLFVYEEDVLIGVVSSYGSYKSKALLNVKADNPYAIYDKAGNLISSGSMAFANATLTVN